MVFVVPTYNLVAAVVPKAACTSLKRALYRLEHGVDYAGTAPDGTRKGLQNAFPTTAFDADDFAQLDTPWTVAVIRDPAQRVISTWAERIMGAGRLEAEAIQRNGQGITRLIRRAQGLVAGRLETHPSLDHFVLNLDHYAQNSRAVAHHIAPATRYLGEDLDRYDRIYRVDELDQLQADIRDRTGRGDFTIPHANPSPQAFRATIDDLSDAAFSQLMARLAPEYDRLAKWIAQPTRADRNTRQTGTI